MPSATAARATAENAVAASGKTKGLKLLGYLCWFSVPDQPVTLPRLRSAWVGEGLDATVLPKGPKSLHIFKRAVSELKGRVRINGHTIVTDVRPVREDAEECAYQVSRVTVDERKVVVDYPKAMRVRFVKANEDLVFEALGGVSNADLLPMQEQVEEYFDSQGTRIDGRKVRAIVRKYLSETTDETRGTVGLGGTNLRGKAGGLYFIPERYRVEIDSVQAALRKLYPSAEHGLSYVPMVDGRGERELVKAQHVARSKEAIEEAIGEVAKLLREERERGVRSNTKDHHWAVLRTLKARTEDYKKILGEEEEDLALALEVAEKQMEKLAA